MIDRCWLKSIAIRETQNWVSTLHEIQFKNHNPVILMNLSTRLWVVIKKLVQVAERLLLGKPLRPSHVYSSRSLIQQFDVNGKKTLYLNFEIVVSVLKRYIRTNLLDRRYMRKSCGLPRVDLSKEVKKKRGNSTLRRVSSDRTRGLIGLPPCKN